MPDRRPTGDRRIEALVGEAAEFGTLPQLIGVLLVAAADTLSTPSPPGSPRPGSSGTLFAMDPVVGALAGLVLLSQAVSPAAVVGILLVVAAGAALMWMSESPPESGPQPSA
ncbi:hypothetical protein [Actinoplanes sp. NPDC026670]|uniref:hypothetical protein n=1 Tax=Actinoplanes sp. NPDC026670 TaxID=3154700 RepID=UPI0033C93DF1